MLRCFANSPFAIIPPESETTLDAHNGVSTIGALTSGEGGASTLSVTGAHIPAAEDEVCELGSSSTFSVGHLTPFLMTISVAVGFGTRMVTSGAVFGNNVPAMTSPDGRPCGRVAKDVVGFFIVLYCIVFKYLYSAPQQPKANRGACGSISSKKRDKF